MDFLPRFRTGASTCYCEKFVFLKYHRFYLLSHIYRCKEKLCHFFPGFKASITHISIDFITLENLFSKLAFRKELTIFLFLSAMSEKQESTISESLKFTSSIKKAKNYFLHESFIDKALQFKISFLL